MRRLTRAATIATLMMGGWLAGAGPAAAEAGETGGTLPSTGGPEAIGLLGIGLVAQALVFHFTRSDD